MADLTQTPASVGLKAQVSKNLLLVGQFGETVANGQPVYLKTADGKYWRTTTTTLAESTAVGIALTGGAADDWGVIALPGASVDLGATLVVAEVYAIGGATGTIAPEADLVASGKFPCILGYASAADTLVINIQAAGVAIP